MAVIALLAAWLLPSLSAAKGRARQMVCLNNLRQISLGLRMYCDDANDQPPATRDDEFWTKSWSRYRGLINNYVGLKGEPSPQDKVFACPADTFYYDLKPLGGPSSSMKGCFVVPASLHAQTNFDYSSYSFNGGVSNVFNLYTNILGIGGRKLSSIKDPVKTVLLAEAPALFPYSWHQPGKAAAFGAVSFNNGAVLFEDARNMVSFVDGHVSLVKIYWNPSPVQPGVWSLAMQYDPPAGYDYKWSGD